MKKIVSIAQSQKNTLNDFIGSVYSVLDSGFIRVVDIMGDDDAIAEAARVSYGKGTKTKNDNNRLIARLMKDDHTSPFEMCEIKLHIKMPIMIARQWIRHRTASVNEYSARYSVVDNCFYIPSEENIKKQSIKNKQGRGVDDLNEFTHLEQLEIKNKIAEISSLCHSTYAYLLSVGLSRELARMILPVNTYTEIYWKIDLHNLLKFIKLRINDSAQFEIAEYAKILLHHIVKYWVPQTYESFVEFKLN